MRKNRKFLTPFFWALALTMLFKHKVWADDNHIIVKSEISHPYILSAEPQTIYLKVALKGAISGPVKERPLVNVALVLDKSGSMSGQKISDVREAAKMLIDRLQPKDVVSVITYDDTANVIVPATKLENPDMIKGQIDEIFADGGTALYAGVKSGADEVKKFLSDNQVNRVILLSDGLANVGPSSPAELGRFGASLIEKGISVSTIGIGLGYNEDLMAELAGASDGFHQFAEDTSQLNQLFDWEFGKLGSIVANDVNVRVAFAEGIRPVRFLGREGQINGNTATVRLNQIFSSHEIYVMVEAKIQPSFAGGNVADVEVGFYDLANQIHDKRTEMITASLTDDKTLVESSRNSGVMIAAFEQKAALDQVEAIRLRDQGQTQAAQDKLEEASSTLSQAGDTFSSERLKTYGELLKERARAILDEAEWAKNRKTDTVILKKALFTTY